jgi:transcriptional regulator with GAF, ATPase, and Fis domain
VAHRGTLFLDEIGDLSPPLQAKILRVIEERRFERVGSNTPLQVDVRLVAATNKNLRAAVAAARFREDLYFRLSVLPITVPALRERASDIPVLAQHFIERFSRELKKRVSLSPAALDALLAYPWPGNVRELQNCLERSVILAEGETIQPAHLQLPATALSVETLATPADPWAHLDWSGSLSEVSRRALGQVERRKILKALDEAGGDRVRTAAALQVPVRFLLAKIREYRIA